MKILLILVSITLLTGVWPVCSASAAENPEKITLQLKWLHQFQFAGYYAAIHKGFYAEEGLEVELLEPEVGQNSLDVLLAGEADFAVSASDIVKRVAEGDPLVALGVIYQHSPLVLVSLWDSGIETLHDLAGKTLIMEANLADLLAMFKAEGVDISELKFIPHGFSVDGLVDGEGAALSAYVTDEPFVLRRMGFETRVFSPRASGIDFYGDNLATTRELAEKDPGKVDRFLRASLRGWEYALQNEDEIIDLILSDYSQRKTREELEYEAMKTRILVRPDLVEIGYMNPGRWAYISQVFKEVGLLDQTVDPYDLMYRSDRPFPWKKILFFMGLPIIFAIAISIIAFGLYKSRRRLQREIKRRAALESKVSESERIFRNMFESAPLAFLFWDKDLRVRRWNPAAEKMFGWKAEEIVGEPFMDYIVPEDEKNRVSDNNETIPVAGLTTFENWNLRKDGTRIYCEWHNVAKYDEDGEFTEGQSIAIDSTAKYLQEEKLKLNVSDAVEANEQKGRFLATVSHEIRNPLAAIVGMARLIEETAESEESRDLADTISSSGNSLIRILSDLIEHERLQAGEFTIIKSAVNPGEIASRMVKMYRPVAEEKGIKLSCQLSDRIVESELDVLRVEQILTNLISNAIKFTERGAVEVIFEFKEKDVLPIHFEVRDEGVGMNAEEAEQVFDLFNRGKRAKDAAYEGSGVGLTISRKLAELMGGSLTVESEPGKGSVFFLDLPTTIPAET